MNKETEDRFMRVTKKREGAASIRQKEEADQKMKRRRLPTKRKPQNRPASDVYNSTILAQLTSESIKFDAKRKKGFGVV